MNALSYCLRAVDGDLERDHLGLPTYDELSGTATLPGWCLYVVVFPIFVYMIYMV